MSAVSVAMTTAGRYWRSQQLSTVFTLAWSSVKSRQLSPATAPNSQQMESTVIESFWSGLVMPPCSLIELLGQSSSESIDFFHVCEPCLAPRKYVLFIYFIFFFQLWLFILPRSAGRDYWKECFVVMIVISWFCEEKVIPVFIVTCRSLVGWPLQTPAVQLNIVVAD